jgi:hypothetical protein
VIIILNYTDFCRITKAIENSAKDVKDPLMVGFLQIDKAYDYLRKYANDIDQDIDFNVRELTFSVNYGLDYDFVSRRCSRNLLA